MCDSLVNLMKNHVRQDKGISPGYRSTKNLGRSITYKVFRVINAKNLKNV